MIAPRSACDRGGGRNAAARPREVGGRGGVEFLGVAAIGAELVVAVLRQHRRAALRHDPARERDRRGGEIALDDGVDQAGCERRGGRDRIAGEDHRHRLVEADKARQPLGAAGARDQAELDLGQPEPRARRRHPEMAAERDLEAAAQRRAMHGGDDGLLARLDSGDHVDGRGLARRLAEFADVGAGNEGAPGADDHDGSDAGIGACPRHRIDEPGAHRVVQRVDGRIVDGDDATLPSLRRLTGSDTACSRSTRITARKLAVRCGKCDQSRIAQERCMKGRRTSGIGLAIVGAGRVGLFRGEVAARHPAVEWIGIAERERQPRQVGRRQDRRRLRHHRSPRAPGPPGGDLRHHRVGRASPCRSGDVRGGASACPC